MAAPPEPSSRHLAYLRGAQRQAARYAPWALLRGAEARAPHLPRWAASRLPSQDIARLAHAPSLAFAAGSVAGISLDERGARITGAWLGLTGPMGPLPIHLSQVADDELRHARHAPYGRFLDLLAERMLQLFYRADADARPAAQADRPADDQFAAMLFALTGANVGVGDRAALPALARLRYAALYVSPRSAVGIEDAMSDLLRLPTRVIEYVPVWRDIPPEDQTRLGAAFSTLGQDAFSGRRARSVDGAFRLVVVADTYAQYRALLPGGRAFSIAAEALAAFTPAHLDWSLELSIPEAAIAGASLGGQARLGWSSWIAPRALPERRADARLGRDAALPFCEQRTFP